MRRDGFTLLELMTVIVVISILIVMLMPAIKGVQDRMEKATCSSNLRNLATAAHLYVQDNQQWPQISTKLIQSQSRQYAELWQKALEKYGIGKKNWICPTIQKQLKFPDYENDAKFRRLDYIACPFDTKPQTPYMLSGQPWFIERADVHGTGNLLVYGNGTVRDLQDVAKKH